MNPEAVEWLESLTDDERADRFKPTYSYGLYTLKADHMTLTGWAPDSELAG